MIHDTDLARLGGGNRKIKEVPFDELRRLDIGVTDFGTSDFPGERVPTLDEMLIAADGRIGLNIEIKVQDDGTAKRLAEKVTDRIRTANRLADCVVSSQSYDVVRSVKLLEPRLKVGWIVARAVG